MQYEPLTNCLFYFRGSLCALKGRRCVATHAFEPRVASRSVPSSGAQPCPRMLRCACTACSERRYNDGCALSQFSFPQHTCPNLPQKFRITPPTVATILIAGQHVCSHHSPVVCKPGRTRRPPDRLPTNKICGRSAPLYGRCSVSARSAVSRSCRAILLKCKWLSYRRQVS